jgi:hypothetical protein
MSCTQDAGDYRGNQAPSREPSDVPEHVTCWQLHPID